MPERLELIALPGIPLVEPGDDLVALIVDALAAAETTAEDGDVLVVAQKIVSKAEGRIVDLADVEVSKEARDIAAECEKDSRLVEVILSESERVLRLRPGLLIVVHRLGLVLANAGVDASNVGGGGGEKVLLLPEDPDATCRRLRSALGRRLGVDLGVIVNDSVGRAWRNGTVGMALGAAGVPALVDLRGRRDLFGRHLTVSEEAIADELAAAATLVQGQGEEGLPVVLVKGFRAGGEGAGAATLIRPREEDLFL